MKTLLVLDDLGMLLQSKNRFVKILLRFYINYLVRIVNTISDELSKKNLVIAGPREIVSKLHLSAHVRVAYDESIDSIDWREAGKGAAAFADLLESSTIIRENCSHLYEGKTSIPKAAYVRLSHLFCYDPLAHGLLIQNLVRDYGAEEVIVLSCHSEIERTSIQIAHSKSLKTLIYSDDFFHELKEKFVNYLYERDRKLHTKEELKKNSFVSASFSEQHTVFIPAHSLHFKTLLPLAKKMNETASSKSLVLLSHSLTSFSRALDSEGIAHLSLDAFSYDDKQNFPIHSSCVSNLFQDRNIKSALTDLLVWKGISWLEVMEEKIRAFFKWSFWETLVLKKRFEKAFLALKPRAVFVFSDARLYESAGAAAARELNIPVFFYSPNPIMSLDEINRYDKGDHLFLGGSYIRDLVVSRKYMEPDRISVVGDVRFDAVKEWKKSEKIQKTRNELKVQDGKKVFLLISWYTNLKFTNDEKILFFSTVWNAFKNEKNAVLVIKAHPNESEEELKNFTKALGINALVLKDMPLYELLAVSSGILTTASMTSLEAMIFDVPVLVIDLPSRDYDYYIPLKRGGGALPFKNSEELRHLIHELLNNAEFFSDQVKKGNDFISKYIEKKEEGAASKIIQLMNEKLKTEHCQKVVAIIQARASSTRLPNKVLAKLSGKTVLEHVVSRVRLAKSVHQVVVATSGERSDDPIEALCKKSGIECYRGSLSNVLERFVETAQKYKADIVVRVTADSPLVEPKWIDEAVQLLIRETLDHVNAKLPEEFPVGTGSEVITRSALEISLKNAKTAEDFEHVTWYCLSHRNQFKIHFLTNPKGKALKIRLTLDEPDDLKLLEELFKRLHSKNSNFGYEEIVKLYETSPELFGLNQHVQEKPNLYAKTLR